ncbi:MAG: hypothetical protein WCA15_03085 [Candidatus Acidiferrales bacterium]
MNARPVRNKQLGGGKIKLIVTLVILGFAGFSAYRIVPAYFANYQLQDMIKSEALFATSAFPRKTPDDVHSDVWKKIQELGIAAKPEDVKVTGSEGQAVSITVDYSVPVDLVVYQFTLEFHPHADSHSI